MFPHGALWRSVIIYGDLLQESMHWGFRARLCTHLHTQKTKYTLNTLKLSHNTWKTWEKMKSSVLILMSRSSSWPSSQQALEALFHCTRLNLPKEHLTLLFTLRRHTEADLVLFLMLLSHIVSGWLFQVDWLLWPVLPAEDKAQFVGWSSYNEWNHIQFHGRHLWSLTLWEICAWWVL